jgi:hypothetical protein
MAQLEFAIGKAAIFGAEDDRAAASTSRPCTAIMVAPRLFFEAAGVTMRKSEYPMFLRARAAAPRLPDWSGVTSTNAIASRGFIAAQA